LSCNPKQLDSLRAHHKALGVCVKDGILTLYDVPYPGNLYTVQRGKRFSRLQFGQPTRTTRF
jgi:hypothetical protein